MKYAVRGYFHPDDAFKTISQWENIAREFIAVDKDGFDTRGGIITANDKLTSLIMNNFGYQLNIETAKYKLLTEKNVLDFIEDFVNHRVWQLRNEFEEYFINSEGVSFINDLKLAFFYSRGDLEPFVLLDDNFTYNVYGTLTHKVTTMHWTSSMGFKNIILSLQNNDKYALSTFTTQYKKYFRPDSNYLIKFEGNLVGAFKSDIKSISTDNGYKAMNMYRLGYHDGGSNICNNLDLCQDENKSTYLWNEIIIYPTKVLEYKKVNRY